MDSLAKRSSEQVFIVKANFLIEAFEEGALLLRQGDQNLIELNRTAYEIITLTDGSCTISQVAQKLAQIYDKKSSDLLEDVTELYEQLNKQGIIQPCSDK